MISLFFSESTALNLDAAKTYQYAVIADGLTGPSPLSGEASAQHISGAPTLTVDTSTDSSVTVTWNTVSGANSYRLYSSTTSVVTTSDNQTVVAGNSYTVSGLTSGDTLYFSMIAESTVGQSGLSSEVTATAVPAQPGTLSANPFWKGGAVELNWTASAGADGYRVYYKAGSHATLDTLASAEHITDPTITYTKINGLGIAQSGTYAVMAYNAGGSSVWTNVIEEQAIPREPKLATADVSRPGKVTLT